MVMDVLSFPPYLYPANLLAIPKKREIIYVTQSTSFLHSRLKQASPVVVSFPCPFIVPYSRDLELV